MLLAKRKKKRVIVFVCTGNTCRSPMALGLLQDYLDKNNYRHIEVKTAGVMTIPGLLPTPEAVQVMESVEIDIRKHRSAPLSPEMLRKSDLVLGMTPFHVQFALRMSTDARGKTFLLKEYTKSDLKNYQITDPMGATLEVYKRVFREIKLAIDKLVEMDVVHAPLDQALRHEKWTGPSMADEKTVRRSIASSAKRPAEAPAPASEQKAAAASPKKKKKAAPKKEKSAPAAKAKEDAKPGAKKPASKAAAAKAPAKKASAKKASAKAPAKKASAKKTSKK
ncbi:MAG: protein arginine phosphatase [Candidatus Sumerlaeota bacterium]|nr:protein arginine phosphatase [Candidatus Sumerlaeota bacterium]